MNEARGFMVDLAYNYRGEIAYSMTKSLQSFVDKNPEFPASFQVSKMYAPFEFELSDWKFPAQIHRPYEPRNCCELTHHWIPEVLRTIQ
ncbi:hypothetical protein EKO04_004346 [Ascochyta lentis]|uniref:Uncharacterized protein n=1 Tax=Ascochyta lentis TaxID=205686 RepID=A0A8H7J759_9PLEO|nr:hypothetical protein EKO04_004346 [Ascochyta lentis]